jgi:hypothetical protein
MCYGLSSLTIRSANAITVGQASPYPYLFRGMEYDATGLYDARGIYCSQNLGRPQIFSKRARKWLNLLRYAARRPIRASNGWTRCSRRAAMLLATFTLSPTLQL